MITLYRNAAACIVVDLTELNAAGMSIPYPIAPSSNIQAIIRQGTKVLAGPVACLSYAQQADWDNQIIAVSWNSSETIGWLLGSAAVLELDIELSGNHDKWVSEPIFRIMHGHPYP